MSNATVTPLKNPTGEGLLRIRISTKKTQFALVIYHKRAAEQGGASTPPPPIF